MESDVQTSYPVAVIGAGPAGLYAAKNLAEAGAQVALINRDIKPGGLAEYGIFHNKHKMKNGLRKQFRRMLDEENIHYFGNVSVGTEADITLDDLKGFGFGAIMVTVGAQGTKWLGLPGEDLKGVYHAKDLVYHFNQLPPYSEQEFPIGRKVVCIGVGNVMLDIANWTIRDLKVDQVTAVARRGPADVKFTKKEMGLVARNLDLAALDKEIERTAGVLTGVDQDPEAAKEFILSALKKANEPVSDTRFGFDFLASPKGIVGDADGNVIGLEVEDTTLTLRDGGGTRPKGLGTTRVVEADTVVFCIGDRVDADFGLPLDKWQDFAKHPEPRFPVDEISFEAYDPENEAAVDGVFLSGWAREASSGLVGAARKDGERGARAALAYLETCPPPDDGPGQVLEALRVGLDQLDKRVVDKADWTRLEAVEQRKAEEQGLEFFKFSSNEEMLAAIGSGG